MAFSWLITGGDPIYLRYLGGSCKIRHCIATYSRRLVGPRKGSFLRESYPKWPQFISLIQLGCDIGGAKEPGVIYFPTNWGAKEPQNLPNHRVVRKMDL